MMSVHDSQIKLTIRARLPDVSILGVTIRVLADEFGLEMMACTEIELAVVEAVTNVVKHGLNKSPDALIEITLYSTDQLLAITIFDQGIPMPADALDAADGSVFDYIAEDIEGWPTSGMGLSLIKAVMDEVQYNHDETGNTLRLIKKKLITESTDVQADN
ncbi:MAG TPA: ATP-binding protein [Agitococcus sp.]|nr:ATP-binding protein [Agitococcus sp.]